MLKKFFMIIFFSLILISVVQAEIQHIESTGEYVASTESFIVAEDRARNAAKRSAVEQAGFFIKSSSIIKNSQLHQDEIEFIAAQVLYVDAESITKKILPNGDIQFIVQLKSHVEIDRLNLEELLRDRQELNRQLQIQKILQSQYDEQTRSNDEFKRAYANRQNSDTKTLEAMARRRKFYSSAQRLIKYMNEAFDEYLKKNYVRAIELCNKALEFYSDVGVVQFILADSHFKLGNYKEALTAAKKILSSNVNTEIKNFAQNIIDVAQKHIQ